MQMALKNPLMEPVWFTPPDGSSRQLWKDSPSPPQYVPPPALTAAANTPQASPEEQMSSQAKYARFNAVGPGGSQTWADTPTSGTLYTTLSGPQQEQFNLRNQIASQLLGRASSQIPQIPSSPFNFNEATPDAAKAQYNKQVALLQPQFERNDKDFEQRMANMGLPVGSDAYNEAMRQHENDKNFALTQASQDATTTGANMALQQRQQNYNELAALLGGQQLQMAPGGAGQGPVNASAAYANQAQQQALAAQQLQQQYQSQMAGYNAGVAGNNSTMGGLFGLGSAAITAFSDRRLKRGIKAVARMLNGLVLYSFEYVWGGGRCLGYLADEVRKLYPRAVSTINGYQAVSYGLVP
jgi:hypothetical protein